MNQQNQQISQDDATLAMAASVVDRTLELIQDGWVKGALNSGKSGVTEFCIHGAMGLAMQEMFGDTGDTGRVNVCGGYAATNRGYASVEAIATAYIVEEAASQYSYDGNWAEGSMAAAPFNDDPERKHEDVLNVLKGASKRLWATALDEELPEQQPAAAWAPSKWASNEEAAKQVMFASIA